MRTEQEIRDRLEAAGTAVSVHPEDLDLVRHYTYVIGALLPVLSYEDSRKFMSFIPPMDAPLTREAWEEKREQRLQAEGFSRYISATCSHTVRLGLPTEQIAVLLENLVWLYEDKETLTAMEATPDNAEKIAIACAKYGSPMASLHGVVLSVDKKGCIVLSNGREQARYTREESMDIADTVIRQQRQKENGS